MPAEVLIRWMERLELGQAPLILGDDLQSICLDIGGGRGGHGDSAYGPGCAFVLR